MNRKIAIKTCIECPHKGHKGGFATISYVPKCGYTGKELPHGIGKSGGIVVASPTGVIPDWCPLEEDQS